MYMKISDPHGFSSFRAHELFSRSGFNERYIRVES